jgi:hypothetical protein
MVDLGFLKSSEGHLEQALFDSNDHQELAKVDALPFTLKLKSHSNSAGGFT